MPKKPVVLITDFDRTLIPSWHKSWQNSQCVLKPGYYATIDYVKTHQIPWYGSTGRTFKMVKEDPLLSGLPFHGIGCTVGTELWRPQSDGTYQQCPTFVSWMEEHQTDPGFIPFDPDHIQDRVAAIVGELDTAGKPIFVPQPEYFHNRFKVSLSLVDPRLLDEYLNRFHAALVGISHQIIFYHGVSPVDTQRPNVTFDILHPRASKSSTTAFCEREHPDSLIIFAGDSGNDVGAVDPHNPKHRIIVVGNAHDDFRQWVSDTFPPDRCFIGHTEQHQEADAVIAGLRHFHSR